MSQYHLPRASYTQRKATDNVVIHASDTPPAMDIGAAEIRGWHIKERGWIDIGYNVVIRRNGVIELGRPIMAQGAGVTGHNANSIHICLIGGRKAGTGPGTGRPAQAENNYTPEQFRSLESLLLMLRDMDSGAERIMGHRDFGNTGKECPSFSVAEWLRARGIAEVE